MSVDESTVEVAALEWFQALGDAGWGAGRTWPQPGPPGARFM